METMLTPYRRHTATCPHRAKGRAYLRCDCPVWADGTLQGRRVHRALDTRSWKVALERLAAWEMTAPAPRRAPEVPAACDAFLADAEARNLAPATLRKLGTTCQRLADWCEANGIGNVADLSVAKLREFRASWTLAASTQSKELERLRAVTGFWAEAGWIRSNYGKAIKGPRPDSAPTMPYTTDDITRMIAAVDRLGVDEVIMQERCRVLIWVLRYTGLRISDATQLHASQIDHGRIVLRQTKTGTPVMLPVPAWLLQRLDAIKQGSGYYFKMGSTRRPEVDAGNWRRRFSRLAKLCGWKSIQFHRFRDSFSVGLLEAGVSIEVVSRLLGHASIKVTERHYAPWVKSRQVLLETAVEAAHGESGVTRPLQRQFHERKH